MPFSSSHIKTDIKRIEFQIILSANIYLFKISNMKIRERLEIVQINNDLNGAFLVSSLLILNIRPFSGLSIVTLK